MGRSRSRDRDKDTSGSRRNRRSTSSSGSSGSSSSSRSSSSRSRSSSNDRDRNSRGGDRERDPRVNPRDPRRYSAAHRAPAGGPPRSSRRGSDSRNNRAYSPSSKRRPDHRPGYPGDPSGWYAQPYGPQPPPGPDGHPMPPFQNFYNSEGYPPDYQGQFGADYAYGGYDPSYYGAPPDFQPPPPHEYGMPGPTGNWDGNNIVYPDVSVPPPPAPVIPPPTAAPQGPDMVPPPPVTHAPEPINEAKKEAVEQELLRQNRSLAMQRDEYVKKKASLNRELSRLKDQKRELVKENSKDNERILRENAKLQAEIQQKLKSIDNVIEMFSSIIGDSAGDDAKKDSSRSESKKSEKSEKRKRSSSPRSETPKKKIVSSSPSDKPVTETDKGKTTSDGKFNLVHYDPEMYWCSACDEFPRSLNEYLTHLHSAEHRIVTATEKDSMPWQKDETREMTPPFIKDALSKRVPLRGAQFLVPSAAWYCTMCKTWLGDIETVNKHLRSLLHGNSFNDFISQNPHWEVDWLTERTRAYERSSEKKRFKRVQSEAGGPQQDLGFGNLSDQIIAMLNSRKPDPAKDESSSSDSSSDSDSGRRSRREKKSKKKKSKKKKKERESKKDKSKSPRKKDWDGVDKSAVERPPVAVEEIKPPEPVEPPKPVAEPPRFHDMNFTPAFHPEMKYKFNSKGVFEETKMIWGEPKAVSKLTIEPPAPVPAPAVLPSAKEAVKEKRDSPGASKKDKRRDRSFEGDDDRRTRRSSRDRDRSYDRRRDYRRYDRRDDRDRRGEARDRSRERDRDRGGRDAFSSKDFYGPKEPPKKGGRTRDNKTPERDKNDRSKRLYLPGKEDDEEANVETAFEKRTSESAAKKKDEKKKTSFVIPKTRLPFIGRMPILKKKVDQKEESQMSEAKENKDTAETVNAGSTLELMNEMSVEEDSRQSAEGEDNNAEDSTGEEDTPVVKPTVMIGKRRNYKNRADDNLMEQDMDIEEELATKEEAKEHNAELHRDFKEALDLLFPEKKDGQVTEDKKIPEVPKVTTQITTSAPPQPYPVYDMSMYTDPATAAAYSMYYDPNVAIYVQQYMAMGYDQASAMQAVQAAYGVDPTLYMQQQAAAMTAVAPAPLPPPAAAEVAAPVPVATANEAAVAAAENNNQATPQSTPPQPPVETESKSSEPVTNDLAPPPSETKPKRKNPLSQRMRRHLKKKAEKEAVEKGETVDGNEEAPEDDDDEGAEEEVADGAQDQLVETLQETPLEGEENGTAKEPVEPQHVLVPPSNDVETLNDTKVDDAEPKKPFKVEEMSELAMLGIEEDDITAQSFF